MVPGAGRTRDSAGGYTGRIGGSGCPPGLLLAALHRRTPRFSGGFPTKAGPPVHCAPIKCSWPLCIIRTPRFSGGFPAEAGSPVHVRTPRFSGGFPAEAGSPVHVRTPRFSGGFPAEAGPPVHVQTPRFSGGLPAEARPPVHFVPIKPLRRRRPAPSPAGRPGRCPWPPPASPPVQC